MGGLGIEDITIGYSTTGASAYVADLNSQAIIDTSSKILDGIGPVKDTLNGAWQGDACIAFCNKLSQSSDTLIDKLKEMEALFNATMAAQEETYFEQDQGMAEEITGSTII